MKPIRINGKEYERLAVASTYQKGLAYARDFYFLKDIPYTETNGRIHRSSDGKALNTYLMQHKGRWYFLSPVTDGYPQPEPAKKRNSTARTASGILKAQKAEYQKIFRAEVRKSSDPKSGAIKAGKIYRKRYGQTPEIRWKRALEKARK